MIFKHWKDLEEKIKNGNINLQTDFRLYPKKIELNLKTYQVAINQI
jgi:hypothetical protein